MEITKRDVSERNTGKNMKYNNVIRLRDIYHVLFHTHNTNPPTNKQKLPVMTYC